MTELEAKCVLGRYVITLLQLQKQIDAKGTKFEDEKLYKKYEEEELISRKEVLDAMTKIHYSPSFMEALNSEDARSEAVQKYLKEKNS